VNGKVFHDWFERKTAFSLTHHSLLGPSFRNQAFWKQLTIRLENKCALLAEKTEKLLQKYGSVPIKRIVGSNSFKSISRFSGVLISRISSVVLFHRFLMRFMLPRGIGKLNYSTWSKQNWNSNVQILAAPINVEGQI
jgi:hypothetical protein